MTPRSRFVVVVVVVVVAVVAALGCAPPVGPHALWSLDGDHVDNPLLDERELEGGEVRLRPSWFEPYLPDDAATFEAYALFEGYARHYREASGFGTFASSFVRLSAPLDDGALDGAVKLLALDEGRALAADVTRSADRRWLRALPREPLAPSARHATVILDGLKSGGAPLVRSPDAWRAASEGALLGLDEAARILGVERERVLLVAPYTTADPTAELLDAAQRLDGRVPLVRFDALAEGRPRGVMTRAEAVAAFPGHEQHLGAAGVVAIGVMSSLSARDDDGVLAAAALEEERSEELEVVLVEPDAARFPPPWPCVVAQHGFSGNNRFAFDVARELNEAGFAVLSIDAVSHGSRGNVFHFFNVEDPRQARDNFRQTVVDLVQLAELARAGDIDVDGVAGGDLTGEVHYFGHSMGAIVGALFAAVAPQPTTVVLNAPGGGITRIFGSDQLKSAISLLTLPALGLSYGDPVYDEVLPFLEGVAQGLFDAADPINYARLVVRERPRHLQSAPRVLVVEGVGDRLVPNTTTDDLVAAMGLSFVDEEQRAAAGLFAAWRVDMAAFGVSSDEDPHNNHFLIPEVRAQAAEFIRSRGTVLLDPEALLE